MEDNLINILESFGFPVLRQGSLTEGDKYPSDFFTFWNIDSPIHANYNNDEYGTAYAYYVNFYSNNPDNTYNILATARATLKAAGWIIPSKGYDVMSDEPTHTGRGMEVYYLDV